MDAELVDQQSLHQVAKILADRQRDKLNGLMKTLDCSIGKKNTQIEKPNLLYYLKTQPIVINGNSYLIDDNCVIFDDCDTNTIVGRQLDDGQYEWF
jgi:hypothetical protein